MRYIIGFFVTLGLIALLIILLISGGKKSGHAPTKSLTDYASTDAQVVMTIDGPINADSLHDQIRITVDNSDVTYQQIKGYQGHVVKTRVFTNNEQAYDVFLHALLHAGFMVGNNDPALSNESGWCALGDRFVFNIKQDGKVLQHYWNTSCDKTKTYYGNTNLTVTLFQAQVPGYDDLVKNLDI